VKLCPKVGEFDQPFVLHSISFHFHTLVSVLVIFLVVPRVGNLISC